MWQQESEPQTARGRKRSASQRQQSNFLLNEPLRDELHTHEQTSFLGYQDTLDVTMSYLPLRDVRSCRTVNVLWADTALQHLEGRKGEIARFVIAYNDEVFHRLNTDREKYSLKLETIGKFLCFFMSLCPCAVLPWLYLHTPWYWSWSVTNTVFDVLLGVLLAISLVVMIVGWATDLPPHTWLSRLLVSGAYFVAFAFFVSYLIANRWPEVVDPLPIVVYGRHNQSASSSNSSVTDAPCSAADGSSSGCELLEVDDNKARSRFLVKAFVGWASGVVTVFSLAVYVAMITALVFFVSQGMELHRAQIRNPLSKERHDIQGYFNSLRRSVSIAELEALMRDDAEAKRRERGVL